jgi:hypothetical protein
MLSSKLFAKGKWAHNLYIGALYLSDGSIVMEDFVQVCSKQYWNCHS